MRIIDSMSPLGMGWGKLVEPWGLALTMLLPGLGFVAAVVCTLHPFEACLISSPAA